MDDPEWLDEAMPAILAEFTGDTEPARWQLVTPPPVRWSNADAIRAGRSDLVSRKDAGEIEHGSAEARRSALKRRASADPLDMKPVHKRPSQGIGVKCRVCGTADTRKISELLDEAADAYARGVSRISFVRP